MSSKMNLRRILIASEMSGDMYISELKEFPRGTLGLALRLPNLIGGLAKDD